MDPTLLVCLVLIVAWIGLLCFIFGIYGRRIDNHPICRHCGFDCYGVFRNGCSRCPECGGVLIHCIRYGNRKPRLLLRSAGAVCVLVCMLLTLGPASQRAFQEVADGARVSAVADPHFLRPQGMQIVHRELGPPAPIANPPARFITRPRRR